MRAGEYIMQPGQYRAFIPKPLLPPPNLHYDEELTHLLSTADRALGRLDGASSILPNSDFFVAMYVKREAVLSSQIEGTQSSLEDLLVYESDHKALRGFQDVEEVVNYVAAMNYGLERLSTLPLSLRLLREIHGRLLAGVRGGDRRPGEFRNTQNWIGSSGRTIDQAIFVPPPPQALPSILDDFEAFLHGAAALPALIHCGMAHAQFETIHPFLDGNGRMGRLLITLLLCERRILGQPLLYLSYYLKAHRIQYYDRLMAIRNDGDWEGWLKFFLRGVGETSAEATDAARAILQLRKKHQEAISSSKVNAAWGFKLLDHLFQHPVISVQNAEKLLACSYASANGLVRDFEKMGILREITEGQRNRKFLYQEYYALFE